jgi:hypothetical protein
MKSLCPFLSALLLITPAMASVSLEFQLGGVEVPPGSLAVLVADTAGNGFTSPSTAPGAPLSVGEKIGADDVIVAVMEPSSLADWGTLEGFAGIVPEIRYADLGIAEGQNLILHVFPERGAGEPVRSGEPFVSYRTEDLGEITPSSTMDFALPADGGAHLLATLISGNGGTADLSMIDLAPLPYGNGPGQLDGVLSPEAMHTYYFEVTSPGYFDLSGSAGTGLLTELFGPDGILLASSSGGNLGTDLITGWHVLRVLREPGGTGNLAYSLDFGSEGIVSPDLAVGAGPLSLTGVDILGGLPGQTVSILSRRARPVLGHASLSNRGGQAEILALKGTSGSPLCGITYLGQSGNLTGAIVAGTFRSPQISNADDPIAIRVLFSPNKKKITKKRGKRSITLRRAFVSNLTAETTTATADPDKATIQVLTR